MSAQPRAVLSATGSPSHEALLVAARKTPHLHDLLQDEDRKKLLMFKLSAPNDTGDCFWFDFSRQKVSSTDLKLLLQLAAECGLQQKIHSMFLGEKINVSERRAVLHTALRADKDPSLRPNKNFFHDHNLDVVPTVYEVLEKIEQFSTRIRSTASSEAETLKDVICIGIGGSYLGPEFVFEALRSCEKYSKRCEGRRLRFLANVDPVDFSRAVEGFDPKTTLVIIVSKTFTTRETMINAKAVREWLLKGLCGDTDALGRRMTAVSANVHAATCFGIQEANVFPFWDWVGGRFSVCSAVGCLPLAVHFGMETVWEFLSGCRVVDNHFAMEPLEKNIPVLMGLFSVWNAAYRQIPATAILPYSQALSRFPAYMQQLAMESNGKHCFVDGSHVKDMNFSGEVIFGEPGTNGQHSFYQLLHQGRPMACDFIGVCHSPVTENEVHKFADQHDELMSNFFAQPKALAMGNSMDYSLSGQKSSFDKWFSGDRPSSSILIKRLSAYSVGMLLALYEHRTAVQGFIFGINSFDQFGVELGKTLAVEVKNYIEARRKETELPSTKNALSTTEMLDIYIQNSSRQIS